MEERVDVVIVGAGIAGLGVGAILAKEARQKVVVLDRFQRPGGRLMSYPDTPEPGWQMDTGLHFIELGAESAVNDLNRRVGSRVSWAPFSDDVEFWDGQRFVSLADMIPLEGADRMAFRELMETIAGLTDPEIEAWDDRSLEEWLAENVASLPIRRIVTAIGMIMTTIPESIDMAAGEVLHIARQNLLKTRRLLSASYPLDGMAGLTRGLASCIEACGGSVRLGCDVQEILFQDGRAAGVHVPSASHPYGAQYRIAATTTIHAERVVCALPIYHLHRIIDFNPATSVLPRWWIRRIEAIREEITGLVGFMIGLSGPVVDPGRRCFYTALKTPHAGLPFQAFAASNYTPRVAPEGCQLLQTDIVCEHPVAADPFERRRLLVRMWRDLCEMFPGIEEKTAWKIPYFVDGCDGLARKPGLVGRFKPPLKAPGVSNLFFAGDTYMGRGLAANGAALSAMACADLILDDIRKTTPHQGDNTP